jgi:long-subunit acyl-CoA synthetase (AMP-forming)
MAILNENGVVQPVGVSGEVCIRGPNVTKGYKKNPEGNKAAFQFGWFHTGDVGFLDEDGFLHLVGRIKELINRGGMYAHFSFALLVL